MKSNSSIAFLAIILIMAGAIITLENFFLLSGVSSHWPILLIILGLGFIFLYFNRQRHDHTLNWLGTFIGLNGMFFYFLNYTSWRNLGTDWPLFLLIIGLSFLSLAVFNKKRVYFLSAVSFISLFLIFFLIFSISAKLWPLSLLFLGIDLLIINYTNNHTKNN